MASGTYRVGVVSKSILSCNIIMMAWIAYYLVLIIIFCFSWVSSNGYARKLHRFQIKYSTTIVRARRRERERRGKEIINSNRWIRFLFLYSYFIFWEHRDRLCVRNKRRILICILYYDRLSYYGLLLCVCMHFNFRISFVYGIVRTVCASPRYRIRSYHFDYSHFAVDWNGLL